MTKSLELFVRVCGYLTNATESVCTEFRVYMDPNATYSLKSEVPENDRCNQKWKEPYGFPTKPIAISYLPEPEYTDLFVPKEFVDNQFGVSWSVYCDVYASISLVGAPNFITVNQKTGYLHINPA